MLKDLFNISAAMEKELILLRHGKSDWNIETDDFHRPLKKRGVQGAKQAGEWLLKYHLIPDAILSSPATRAINTAELVCETLGLDQRSILQKQCLYGADLKSIKVALGELSSNVCRLLLVGHNPGLEELLIYLSGGQIKIPDDGKLLPTATIARLRISVVWNAIDQDCAKLILIKRPEKR